MKYQHFSQEERNKLVVFLNRKVSFQEIGRRLGRNVSTISREVKRNYGRKRYRAHKATERAVDNHHQSHKRIRLKSRVLQFEVEQYLQKFWSPELIAGRLKQREDLPRTNHESIYQWIYEQSPHLIGCLVRNHPQRWPKGKGHRRRRTEQIPDRISIQERPELINSRAQAGHWETDLIIGKGKNAVQVTVERKTRMTRLTKILNKTSSVSRLALAAILDPLPQHLKRSITYDNGSENFEHQILNEQLSSVSYFCQPYHSWEKGSVENTNGLIRRFLPKKTNFDTISHHQIHSVEAWLNSRPRKCLDFKTPREAFLASVALTP